MEFLDTDQYMVDIVNKKEKMEAIYKELVDVETTLKGGKVNGQEYEDLYGKEFKLIVNLSGAYNDIERMLKTLHNQVPEQRFFVNRIEGEISLYKIWETIEI